MTVMTERRYAGEHILSEANSFRSREEGVVDASQTLVAGQVVGKITEGAKTASGAAGVPAPAGATITASPTAAVNTKTGVHRFECIVGGSGTASKWRHTDPDGEFVGIATGNTAYAGGGLSGLTITDSGTDPVAGEAFEVTVTGAAGSGRIVMHDPEATNGAEDAYGILFDAVTTGVGETAKCVLHVRDCEVDSALIAWDDQNNTEKAAAIAQLAEKGVIFRT